MKKPTITHKNGNNANTVLYAAYRIGNLVKWKDEEAECYLTITGIVLNDIIWVEWEWEDGERDDTDCLINSISGIKLTEELMLRLGFEKRQETAISIEVLDYYSLDGYCFMEDWEGKWFLTGYNWNTEHFEYLHQLQNIFYALSGEELYLSGI